MSAEIEAPLDFTIFALGQPERLDRIGPQRRPIDVEDVPDGTRWVEIDPDTGLVIGSGCITMEINHVQHASD